MCTIMTFVYNQQLVALVVLVVAAARCRATITYPGWRGDNLTASVDPVQETAYPCAGLPETTTRTLWPVTGGAVAFRPRWPAAGHDEDENENQTELVSVNMVGLGTAAPQDGNDSMPLVSRFEIAGPAAGDDPHHRPGTVCLPYVPVPGGYYGVRVGDVATIQVVESAADEAATVYSCVDIIFADQADIEGPDWNTCYNSSSITFVSSSSGATLSPTPTSSTYDIWGTGPTSNSRADLFASKTSSSTGTSTPASTFVPTLTNAAAGKTGRQAVRALVLLVALLGALC